MNCLPHCSQPFTVFLFDLKLAYVPNSTPKVETDLISIRWGKGLSIIASIPSGGSVRTLPPPSYANEDIVYAVLPYFC